MSAQKYDRAVHRAMKEAGHSNREIARILEVNEASVRRALKGYKPAQKERQFLVTVSEVG